MKAVRIHAFGGPEVLELDTVERPVPRDDEVLVRVLAASVNPVDWKIREGSYSAVKEGNLPITLGRDISGEVAEAGTSASVAAGDAVWAFIGADRGGYAEYVLAKMDELAPKPESLNHVEAAAVPLAGLTAWQGLFDHGGLQEGQRVLIHGGAGGVGHLAVQFAKSRGAWVATTVGADDVEFAEEIGADQVIDYRNETFEEAVAPVDMVFDLIGGKTRDRSFKVLRQDGILVSTLGEPSRDMARNNGVRVAGYVAQPDGDQLFEIGSLIDAGKVRVEVQRTYPFQQVAEAQNMLQNRHTRGKIVLDLVS
jgi:NADPH:quinone reductase-like Zn-dependent oxidoreductase